MVPTTLASWARVIAATLEAHGIPSRALLVQAGLDPTCLDDPEARFPMSNLQRLWALALERTGDPCFGLAVPAHWHPTSFHALGYSWMASANLREALARLVRYGQMVNTSISPRLEESSGSYRLVVNLLHGHADLQPISMDASLAVILHMCRVTSGERINARRVEFPHAAPPCIGAFEAFFGCVPEFSSTELAITFERGALERPLPSANLALAHANDRVIHGYLSRLDQRELSPRVMSLLVDRLPSGAVVEAAVAKELHLSARSLQRRLKDEGTSFKQLLEETRKGLALNYLRETGMPVGEVAFLLGFSDQSNFSRAIRRWYGKSPLELRAASGGA